DVVADLKPQEKLSVVNSSCDRFIIEGGEQGSEKPPYDLEKDAEYIYASFMHDYGIDLFEQQGKLHWRKFKALLVGLSDDSMFKRVVAIRTMDVPPPTKDNQKERQQIIEMKRAFSLDRIETVEEIDRRYDELALMMKSWAKGGKANGNSHRRAKAGSPRRDRDALIHHQGHRCGGTELPQGVPAAQISIGKDPGSGRGRNERRKGAGSNSSRIRRLPGRGGF